MLILVSRLRIVTDGRQVQFPQELYQCTILKHTASVFRFFKTNTSIPINFVDYFGVLLVTVARLISCAIR